jgi:predicted phage terminase large subunit-like protein
VAGPETGAKATRASPVAAQVEAGNLALLRAGWNRALLDELRDFPTGRKDDQVDALSRAFAMLADAPAGARRAFVPILGR